MPNSIAFTSGGKSTSVTEGDYVVLIKGLGAAHGEETNPIWGKNGLYIRGRIMNIMSHGPIHVQWENGQENIYELSNGTCEILPEGMAPAKRKKVKLDASMLDGLVLDHDVKMEIVSVLKQHQHSDKLFNEWGLGETIEYGRGMTLMFYGSPGTGKTWGANCIAKALGTELLTISAAEIQSSEPGAANRNIQDAFENARNEGKVLFLDECDSLITVRSDVGMILASEINTLLTEIEKTDGVVILATNRIENMDAALERRLSLIVEFPFPKRPERKLIWEKLVPKKMPLDSDVSFDELAKTKLSGGLIKNAVLQAARLAVSEDATSVGLKHFDAAIARIKKSDNLMGHVDRHPHGAGVGVGTGKSRGVESFLDEDVDEDIEEELVLADEALTSEVV